ncbi:MAG: hypothetical protein U9P80_09025 [Thermodesulfobacteriota bacterium]|nr:hypothetical protein [Thermodesulfobacteriota bacterium]
MKDRLYLVVIFLVILSGCALVKPGYREKTSTPIAFGLENRFKSAITIMPFECRNQKWKAWGTYATDRTKEYLLAEQAFLRVVSFHGTARTPYILRGEINDLFYGGTSMPSRVDITIRVIDVSDGNTRFLKRQSVSMEKTAFHMTWFTRVYMASPSTEELLCPLLKSAARDIAKQTHEPEIKCP